MKKIDLLYEQESYKIRGAKFTVYKHLGFSHKEIVYQKALELAFIKQGLTVESEKRLPVLFENREVGVYTPDFLINDKIVIEIKSKSVLTRYDIEQFWHYLTATNYKLGFLINFGRPGGVQIIRRVYDKARKKKLE